MSEFLNNKSVERRRVLLEMAMGLLEGKSAIEYLGKSQECIEMVTPEDVIYLVDEMVSSRFDIQHIKKAVSKLLNIFYEPLNRQQWYVPSGSFLHYFILENQAMDEKMMEVKRLLKRLNKKKTRDDEYFGIRKDLGELIMEVTDYEKHYKRKENVLFPRLEKMINDYRCLHVMWSIHDDFRKSAKALMKLLSDNESQLDDINREMGTLFFAVYPIIFREEKILFPVVARLFSDKEMDEMHNESFELGFSFIDVEPQQNDITLQRETHSGPAQSGNHHIDLGTGIVMPDQLSRMLNILPVDMTFVDAQDEVRYFSNPPHRIFPRSKSIIGRKVQNCHPPESLDKVEEILDSFKSGIKDSEIFWINLQGKFILIQYFAVRNEQGDYQGTLEVSQDVTDIRSLQGKKRLIEE